MRWIKHKTNATVKLIDYGISGTSSRTGLKLYTDAIKSENLKTLDLVLLDYSANDGIKMELELVNDAMRNGSRFPSMEQSAEWLIRRLLLTLHRNLKPVVVLLAGIPSSHLNGSQYTAVYEKLARYYSIPLWSYDSVAQSTALMDKSYASVL
jgi:lysophospholipase L1-like esterase